MTDFPVLDIPDERLEQGMWPAHRIPKSARPTFKTLDGGVWKICSSCGAIKPLDHYYNYRRSFDGKQPACMPCQKPKPKEGSLAGGEFDLPPPTIEE